MHWLPRTILFLLVFCIFFNWHKCVRYISNAAHCERRWLAMQNFLYFVKKRQKLLWSCKAFCIQPPLNSDFPQCPSRDEIKIYNNQQIIPQTPFAEIRFYLAVRRVQKRISDDENAPKQDLEFRDSDEQLVVHEQDCRIREYWADEKFID